MGKGAKREVYDFLLSMDYGVCHGPVDRFNQIWVKDKPIWCGHAKEASEIAVRQPDLFGGDDAEGGVVGVVEVFTGDDEQKASESLASRLGRTVATMPGYRGLAHLFFRGGLPKSAGTGYAAVVGNNPGDRLPSPWGDSGGGFRWTSNNPYMPGVKVSTTRIPKTLDTTYAYVWPITGRDETTGEWIVSTPPPEQNNAGLWIKNGPLGSWQDDPGTVVDLFSLGISPSMIDLGQVSAQSGFSGFAHMNNSTDPASGSASVEMAFFGALSDGSIDFTNEIVPPGNPKVSDGMSFNGNLSVATDVVTVPPGARYVAFRGVIVLTLPFFSTVDIDSRNSTTSYPGFLDNHCALDGGLGVLPDANPAHIIHECLVNPEWGKGEDPANIDTASFNAAAATLYNEHFGLSMIWTRQTEIERFVQEVLDHIQAVLFVDPATGMWTLRLLRDDYDTTGMTELNPSNCRAKKRKRKAWGETINEINVTYTDPQTEKEATVTAHNLANIAIQGGVISETRNYYGVRNPYLAQELANRDVIASGYPLFSATIEVDRSQWDIRPGDVRPFSWPEDGISGMVVRVLSVDYSTPKSRTIKLEVVEDIFSLDQTVYSGGQTSAWSSGREAPSPLSAELALTAPLPTLLRNGYTLADVDDNYPSVGVLLMGSHDSAYVTDIQAHTAVTKGNGSTAIEAVATFPPVRSGFTTAALVPEVTSTLPGNLVSTVTAGQAEAGDLLMLGTSEAQHEIVMLDAYDSTTGEWTIVRGLYDTIPENWPAGTRVWEFPDGGSRRDPQDRAGGETVTYRLLPKMSEGRLAYGDATDLVYTATERPHLPFRPANCQIDGNGLGLADYTATGMPASVPVTWANRNRTSEDQIALRWDDANATPEPGQTTVLRILDDKGTEANVITGLTGTSATLLPADFAGVEFGSIEFLAERGGLRSRTGARRAFDFRLGGYGRLYGQWYGAA